MTISLVQPTLLLFENLLGVDAKDSTVTSELEKILVYLQKHYKDDSRCWEFLSSCSFVDPRYLLPTVLPADKLM